MSIILKYKIHDFAKDIGAKSGDVIEVLNKFEVKERAHSTALTMEEADYLLNYYTKATQVENFDAFLDGAKEEKKPAPEKKPEEKKKAEPAKEVKAKVEDTNKKVKVQDLA